MNKDSVTINGETYVKQQPAPSSIKVCTAKWINWFFSLVFLIPLFIPLYFLMKDLGRGGDVFFLLGFGIIGYISNILASFVTTKIFGESVMNSIPPEVSVNSEYQNTNMDAKPYKGAFVGSYGDPDPNNINYHGRR